MLVPFRPIRLEKRFPEAENRNSQTHRTYWRRPKMGPEVPCAMGENDHHVKNEWKRGYPRYFNDKTTHCVDVFYLSLSQVTKTSTWEPKSAQRQIHI